MEKEEAQQELPASSEAKDAGVPSAEEEDNKKLLNICNNKNNATDTTNTAIEKSILEDTVCDDKSTEKIVNSESTKIEKEEAEEDKNDKKSSENTVDNTEQHNVEKKDSGLCMLKKELKALTTEPINDSLSRIGTQGRRKKSLSALELDSSLEEGSTKIKRRKVKNPTDKFCWRCHKEYVDAHCTACPRAWHRKCIGGMQPMTSVQNWICGECATILRAENAETRSSSMAQLSVDQLCVLLRYVVERMREYPGSEPFWKPVEESEAPNYQDYVVKPMDLSLLESNVRAKLYGSTDAFMADAKWIQHNCIVFNTCGGVYADTSKLTNAAKQIIKLARQEVSEIEACPDCFAHGRNIPRPQPSWFIEPCRRPHPLVWAKLKGFPFWPAKAMPRVNTQGFVDVRFFGQHDRAWVSPRDMYLYSQDPPVTPPRKRKLDMDECVREITRHCRKLELVFGQFKFAPPRVPYNPNDPMQIKVMLPNYDPLQPNNVISPLSISKRKVAVRKRISVSKAKNQVVFDSTDSNTSATADCSTSIDSIDENRKIEGEKTETNVLFNSKSNVQKVNETKEGMPMLHKDNNKVVSTKPTLSDRKLQEIVDGRRMKVNEINAQPDNAKSKTDDANNKSNKQEAAKVDKVDTKSTMDIQKDNITLNTSRNATKRTNDSIEQPPHKIQKIEKEPSALITKRTTRPDNSPSKTPVKKKESPSKSGTTDPEANATGIVNTQKQGVKATKTLTKVYKPKTRMVDKVNAEKALSSVPINEGKKLHSDNVPIAVTPIRNGSELKDVVDKSNDQPSTMPVVLNKSQLQSLEHLSHSPAVSATPKSTADQSVALLLVVNSGVSEPLKQSVTDKDRCNDTTAGVQVLKEPAHIATLQRKESKAKKSFPNKPRNYVHIAARPSPNVPSNSNEPLIYIPTHQAENGIPYPLVPPEAGPLSARMYHGVQDLTRKMAQLMEEAYKEAAEETQFLDGGTTENHQATVHFLKLQIERMRWQHQQQLTELKHNTDRILREMRTSLEAERLRAIEETRKEAEQEKLRCIEEIKRKQWCAMCGHEAVFYCCWNTAYCDYPCQTLHWPTHMRSCAQQPSLTTMVTNSAANTNQQQLMPKLMMNTQHATPNAWRM